MSGPRVAHVLRAFRSLLGIVAFLGAGWLAGLALRSARAVRAWQVDWPADATPGLDLSPAGSDGAAGRPGNHVDSRRGAARGDRIVAPSARSRPDSAETSEPSKGPSTPELHIFGDYECGACLSLHRRLGARLAELAGAGRLRVFYHMAPLPPHWRGALAGEIVYCVPALRQAVAHERIFETHAEWLASADPEAAILDEVAEGPQDRAELRECVASGAGRIAVERDRLLAAGLGVQAVPGIFLSGARIEFDSWRSLRRFVERAASP